MKALDELAARRRFGMKLSLDSMREVCRRLGDPQLKLKAVHIAGTNGKGAVAAMLSAVLGGGRYTSPHLVSLNERFCIDGRPVDDEVIEKAAAEVLSVGTGLTFFEALTAAAFIVYSRLGDRYTVLETGLGGRFDATNVCRPRLSVITRIGLDHCDWLGRDVADIAAEKAGIIKPGVPVVLGRNEPAAADVVRRRADEAGSECFYADDLADESEIPGDFPLKGRFNRENAVTAMAALKVLGRLDGCVYDPARFARTVWPGRFHETGRFIIDGAHNPPAARALAASLDGEKVNLIAGFCSDKDVCGVLEALKGSVNRAWGVATVNQRSLSAEAAAEKMRSAGFWAEPAGSLAEAIRRATAPADGPQLRTLICGSLFLAGEALVELGEYPWGARPRFDAAETLKPQM